MNHEAPGSLPQRIVVVGGGHAGGNFVALLRQSGYPGEVTLVGDEPWVPYNRPPLSKGYLKGEVSADGLRLWPERFYHEQKVTLRLGCQAVAIRRAERTVELDDGSCLPYDVLVLATGSRARKLQIPGADLSGLYQMRNIADADQLKLVIGPGMRVAAVGGGYIGLEAAAGARAIGAEVTVIEREPRLLPRVASTPLSEFMHQYHASHGVEIILNAGVQAFEGHSDGNLSGVRLVDGRIIPCTAALLGVGAAPNDELARECGLHCENGIVVDSVSRTSDPSVFAIGDVAWRPLTFSGNRMFRLESVPNASEGAKQAVAAIMEKQQPAPEVPWFWSDQYDVKIQIANIPFDADDVILRGNVENAKFAVFHMKGGIVESVEAVNTPADFVFGKQLILKRKRVSRDKLQDLSLSMKELVSG